LPENENPRKLKLTILVVVSVVIIAALGLWFTFQRPTKAEVQLTNFSWSNHSPDSNFDTSYVSVQGTIHNLGPGNASNVNVIIDIYVDYQCGIIWTP
jgi:hypothetical protein